MYITRIPNGTYYKTACLKQGLNARAYNTNHPFVHALITEDSWYLNAYDVAMMLGYEAELTLISLLDTSDIWEPYVRLQDVVDDERVYAVCSRVNGNSYLIRHPSIEYIGEHSSKDYAKAFMVYYEIILRQKLDNLVHYMRNIKLKKLYRKESNRPWIPLVYYNKRKFLHV